MFGRVRQPQLQLSDPLVIFVLLLGVLNDNGLLIELVNAKLKLLLLVLQLQDLIRLLAKLLLQLFDFVVLGRLRVSVHETSHALHALRLELGHQLLGLHLRVLRLQPAKLFGHVL